MNSEKFQGTTSICKNCSYFYTLAMNNQKMKIRKKFIYNSTMKNKILRHKFNKRSARFIL